MKKTAGHTYPRSEMKPHIKQTHRLYNCLSHSTTKNFARTHQWLESGPNNSFTSPSALPPKPTSHKLAFFLYSVGLSSTFVTCPIAHPPRPSPGRGDRSPRSKYRGHGRPHTYLCSLTGFKSGNSQHGHATRWGQSLRNVLCRHDREADSTLRWSFSK